MSAVYTRRVAVARLSNSIGQVVYTHQGPERLIVRDIVVSNLHTAAQTLRVYLTTGQGNIDLLDSANVPTNDSVHQDMRQEVLVGEQITFQPFLGLGTVIITGYFLSP